MQLVHQSKPVIPRDRLIRLPEVENIVGCRKSTIYTMLEKGEFVKPIRYSARMVAWSEAAVLQWVQDRINQGATTQAPTAPPAPDDKAIRKAQGSQS